MAIKMMNPEITEQIVKNIELSDKITADPQCSIHHTRLIKSGVGMFCPVCKDQSRIHAYKEDTMSFLL